MEDSWKFFDYLNNRIPWNRPTIRVFGRSCLQVVIHYDYYYIFTDISETALPDVPDIKDLIMSCIAECDEHGLSQYKAWFIAALAQFVFISGYEMEKYQQILQVKTSNSRIYSIIDSVGMPDLIEQHQSALG